MAFAPRATGNIPLCRSTMGSDAGDQIDTRQTPNSVNRIVSQSLMFACIAAYEESIM